MTRDLTERCFRALIENGDDVLVLSDRDTAVEYVSPSIERVLGYTPDEMRGRPLLDIAHPDDTGPNDRLVARILANPGEAIHSQYRARHSDGHYVEMEIRGQNLLHDPEVRALVFSARDVTARNEAVRKAAEQERQLSHLADNARDIVAIYRFLPEPKLEYISPSVERIVGYPRRQFYDDPLMYQKLIHPDDAALQADLVGAPDRLHEPWTLRWIHEDGRVVWIEQNMVPILDEDGRRVAIHSISRDITEKVELEHKLRRAQKMEALGRMAGGVAHDFNNLLGVIRLSIGCLARKHRGAPTRPAELGQIETAVERGARLIHTLLAFSRPEREEADVVNLNDTVLELEEMLRRLLPDSIDVTVDPAASRPWIRLDRSALEQVVVNLVVNASDAMPDGGVLAIATADADHHVTLSVRDTGLGMDDAQLERVFDPFYTTKAPGRGTGLGLSVVYGVVEKSAGRIRVDSSPGLGTEIRIEWPRADEPSTPADDAVPAAEPGNHEMILMVEDEAQLRKLIAKSLRHEGYLVHVAANAAEALDVFRAHADEIDLVLTDVVMPGDSGVELADQIRAQRRDVPVVFMSGHAGDALTERGVTEAVLHKPFTIEDLAEVVRSALDGEA